MATNAYLAYRLGVNDQAIKRALKWLKKAELINLYYFPKNKRGIVVNFALREGEKRPIIPHIDIPIDTFFDYSTEE
jgi:DNA-binding MarR family transcriptional regulator